MKEKASDSGIPTRYEPAGEDAIYELWEKSGLFAPEKCVEAGAAKPDAGPFSIVLPPPNVTGTLHMGHAEMLAVEDIMVRYHRMKGDRTLWLPGTDHAAIATQSKVEKELQKKEGKSRYDLGREEFLRRVEQFAKESHDTIATQMRKMGASVDWGREAFTLDEKRNLAVRTAFERMYDAGLIYRGYRVVNWDPKGQTVISDDEIVYEERKATLYTFKYGKDFPVSISTTRPETKFGDTAVAVHPEDERYKKYVGKTYDVDFLGEVLNIKIIADSSVDMEFGTGALGVTPAHSMVDWELAERHGLPLKQVINEYGKMMVGPEGVLDKKTAEAREKTAGLLREAGLMEKEEDVPQNISTAERTGGIIEPLPKLQWFVAVNKEFVLENSKIEGIPSGSKTTLKEIMRQTVSGGQINILPDRFTNVYYHWIDNLRDWCISRQIWYGHRIPAWECLSCHAQIINADVKERWYFVRHGQTDWNKEMKLTGKSDIDLNEEGRRQAQAAAEQLRNAKIDIILTSGLKRAKETAEAIAQTTGAEIVVDDRLHERDFGQAEGRDKNEVLAESPDFFDWYSKDQASESYAEMEKRIWPIIEEFAAKHPGKNIVFVGHGGNGRIFQKNLHKLPEEKFRDMQPLKNADAVQFDVLQPCPKCGHHFFRQDPDTLDTWFSSGLWTFSTLGWPGETKDLALYHPTSVMETGYDILFFWVARMILMSGFLLGDVPFRTVYLHGLVRDEKGKKMSKSAGNALDPLELTSKYGADAARLSLIIGASQGADIKLSEDRVRGYRNFSTKIWNVARFVLMSRPSSQILSGKTWEDKPEFETVKPGPTAEDELYLRELAETKAKITGYIESFDFHLAADLGYHYFWHTFADKIVEAMKPRLAGEDMPAAAAAYVTLRTILLESLTILHPFVPFVTEAVYQEMKKQKALPDNEPEMLMIRGWNS